MGLIGGGWDARNKEERKRWACPVEAEEQERWEAGERRRCDVEEEKEEPSRLPAANEDKKHHIAEKEWQRDLEDEEA